jgi:predicted nucleic acid-binding Zn ribbon protein
MRHDDDDDWDQDEDWKEDQDDDGYVACPYCSKPMYEEAGYCSACERWISREDFAAKRLPAWMFATIVLCLVALIVGALRLF